MFSKEALDKFEEWSKEAADKKIERLFLPQDRDSMKAKEMWMKTYCKEYLALITPQN